MRSEASALIPGLREILASRLGIEVAGDDTDLFASGLIDSLTLIELLFEAEREFGARVELESFDLEHARTLQSLAEWIHGQARRPTQ